MSRNIGTLVVLLLVLLGVGYLAGYIVERTTMQTYWKVGRAVNAFWIASLLLFIGGIVYRSVFNKLSHVNGVLLFIVLSGTLLLQGFYLGIIPDWRLRQRGEPLPGMKVDVLGPLVVFKDLHTHALYIKIWKVTPYVISQIYRRVVFFKDHINSLSDTYASLWSNRSLYVHSPFR